MTLALSTDFLIPEFSETLTYLGTSYSCIQSEVSEDTRIAEGGLDLDDELSLVVAIACPVAENSTLTFRSTSWRCIRVVTDSGNIMKRLYLAKPFGKVG